jgi:hypothetical protein
MPLTNLNIGAAPNDGTGETLRSGGAKINTNYTFTVTTDTTQDIGGVKTFTGATTRFNGNVGIGTTSPGAKLEVSSSTTGVTSGDLVVDTVNKEVRVGRVSSTSGDNSILVLRSRTNDRFSLSNLGSESRLNVETSNAFTVRTNNTERMRIAADGNVGIGTTNPARLLDVVGGESAAETAVMQLRSNFSVANTATVLRISNTTATTPTGATVELGAVRTSGGGSTFFIRTSPDSGNPTERMRIAAGGNVGIGTTSPGQALDVVGRIQGTSFQTEEYTLSVPGGTPTSILNLPGAATTNRFAGFLYVRDNAGSKRGGHLFFSKATDGANISLQISANIADGYTFTTSGGTDILLEQASTRTVRVTVLYLIKNAQ